MLRFCGSVCQQLLVLQYLATQRFSLPHLCAAGCRCDKALRTHSHDLRDKALRMHSHALQLLAGHPTTSIVVFELTSKHYVDQARLYRHMRDFEKAEELLGNASRVCMDSPVQLCSIRLEAALLARDMGKEDDINRVLADLRSELNRLAGQDKLHVEQQMRKLDRKRSEMHLY